MSQNFCESARLEESLKGMVLSGSLKKTICPVIIVKHLQCFPFERSDESSCARSAETPKITDRASKKGEVIAMMKRSKGVTLAEIMSATGWQAHTERGL